MHHRRANSDEEKHSNTDSVTQEETHGEPALRQSAPGFKDAVNDPRNLVFHYS